MKKIFFWAIVLLVSSSCRQQSQTTSDVVQSDKVEATEEKNGLPQKGPQPGMLYAIRKMPNGSWAFFGYIGVSQY